MTLIEEAAGDGTALTARRARNKYILGAHERCSLIVALYRPIGVLPPTKVDGLRSTEQG
jgi:hypothetical protein